MDLCACSLVSWMNMMCRPVWSFRVSSCIPGRLELIHPAFHVISFRDVVWWLHGFVLLGEV